MDSTFISVMMATMSIMSVVIVAINSLCVYVILKSPLLRGKTASLLIVSLLCCHLLQGLLAIPFYTAKKSRLSKTTSVICDGFRFSYMVTFYGTCINVLLISIDRLLAVRLLTAYRVVVTRKRVKVAIFSMWAYTILTCLIPFIKFKRTASNLNSRCHYNQQRAWTIFMLICTTLASYAVITCCYVYIYTKLNLVRKRLHGTEIREPPTEHTGAKKQTPDSCLFTDRNRKDDSSCRNIKMAFAIIVMYGLTWSPSVFYYLLVTIYPSVFAKSYYVSTAEGYITFFIKVLSFFDAIASPVVYCYFHADFRKELKRYWENQIQRFTNSSSVEGNKTRM